MPYPAPKNCRIICLAFFTCFSTLLPCFYHFTSLTVNQNFLETFVNASAYRHYEIPMTKAQLSALYSTISSVNFFTSLIGALLRFGRKPVLFLMNPALNILGSFFQGLSLPLDAFELLLLGRIFSGLSAGIANVSYGVYMAEISPSNLRAALGSLANVAGGVGIFIPLLLGLPAILGTAERLPILLALIPSLPGLLAISAYKCVPESPRFHCLLRGNEAHSKKSLQQLGTTQQEEIDQLILEYRSEVSHGDTTKSNFSQALSVPFHRWTLLLVVFIGISNGATSFQPLEAYAAEFLRHAGLTLGESQVMTSLLGLMDVLSCIPSPLWPDRFGRRKCLLGSLGVILLIQILLCIFLNLSQTEYSWRGYATTASTLLLVLVYSCGPGTVPYIVAPEISPIQIRSVATSVGTISRSITVLISVWCFYPLLISYGGYSFVPYILLNGVCLIVLGRYLPETRSLPFHQGITHKLDEQFVKHQVSEFSMEWNPNVELSSACGCALSAQRATTCT